MHVSYGPGTRVRSVRSGWRFVVREVHEHTAELCFPGAERGVGFGIYRHELGTHFVLDTDPNPAEEKR